MKLNSSKLIDARHRKGLNQQEVADGAGVSIITIVNAENGKDVYPATGRKICEFLDIDLAGLVLSVSTKSEGDGDAA